MRDNCMIADAREKKRCSANACRSCGWNPEVAQQRQKLMESRGLRRCDDGLNRLILPQGKKVAR